MISPAVQNTVDTLRRADITPEERQLLTTVLLDRLGALPTRARIQLDETGKIVVDGKSLTAEKAQRLRKSARLLLKNFARTFVQETVVFLAVKQGVHQNLTPEQGLFAKAILYQHQEEQELYRALAGSAFESE